MYKASFGFGVEVDALTSQPPEHSDQQMLSLRESYCVLDSIVKQYSVENFICILQKCRRNKNLAYAERVHAQICNNGLEVHRAIGNYIVPMYVECGSISNAQQAFDRLLHRNECSWTFLMLGYIQCGQPQHALNLYHKMKEDCIHPSSYTFMALVKACVRLKDIQRAREIHAEIAQEGFDRDPLVGNSLVDMYAKCGSQLEAHEIFHKLPIRDVVSWNTLIAGYAEHGPYHEALKCFKQMQLEGISPNAVTFASSLKACGSMQSVNKGRELHMDMREKGFDKDLFVSNALVDMYVKCGSVTEGRQVFDKLPVRDVVSWNALIAGYAEHGPGQEALKCLEQMQMEGISPNAVTFVCILKACGSIGAIEKGREMHIEITKKAFEREPFIGNALMEMYVKCGSLSEAHEVFLKLPVRDVVSWNILIAGYAEHGLVKEALKCFEQMQVHGISPNVATFVLGLKACGSIRAIDKGREIHTGVAQKGFEKDPFVGSTLIHMYAKCGSLSEAQEVFEKLPVQDVVSWNALIAGYAAYGHFQKALKCYEQMQLEGISPSAVTFIHTLKACGSAGAIDAGREIHKSITQKGFVINRFVGSALVDMYAKCGSLLEARKVFDNLPVRDVVSWTALIGGHVDHGLCQEALIYFEQMKLESISPNAVTCVCTLKACGSIGAIDKGREIHTYVTNKGLERDPLVGNSLIDMYVKCGSLPEAHEVCDELPVRDVVSWTALISGYTEHGPCQEALRCFEQMKLEGITPDVVTFVSLLKACATLGAIDKGREIHAEVAQKEFKSNIFAGNTLIDMYSKFGSLSEAQNVFDNLPVRDVVSWNALITGYTEHDLGQEVLKLLEQMQLEGIPPDAVTFVCALKACGKMGAIDKGRELHAEIAQKGFEGDLFIGNTLIEMYAKCGSLLEAQEVFTKLPVRDVVSWDAMINGYGMNHESSMAVYCFEDMQEQGMKPSAITFICLLTACSHAGMVLKGQKYFKLMMEDYGIVPTIDHCSCMVDLLARSGNLYEADNFLETMSYTPSIEIWTALLSACKTYGEVELGLKCFQQLILMNPEYASSYVLMENIYASAGRRDDAFRVEELRKCATAKKKPAYALIEVNKQVHDFVVGNNQSKEISAMLEILSLRINEYGNVPNLDMVLKPIPDEKKEAVLCEHAEKLALAFGLLNMPQGQTLRVTKNMRMCNNCHNANKIISRIEQREIIVRDGYSVHHFKCGLCSCRDIF